MTEEEVEEEEEGAKNQEREELREGGRFGRKGVMEDIDIGRREEAVAVGGGGSGIGGGGVGVGGGVSGGVSGGGNPAAGVWRINSQVNGTGAHLEANIHFNIVK